MGRLTDMIAGFAKALRRPTTEVDQRYVGATVRMGEEASSYGDTVNPRDAVRVGRAMTGTLAVACNLIANAAARGELKLYRRTTTKASKSVGEDDEESEQVTDHPVLDLLRDPDPSMTTAEWFRLLYWYREAAGIAYIWTGGEIPSGLYLFPPQNTRPVFSRTEGITAYKYAREPSRVLHVPASEVVTTRWRPDPMNPLLASSWTDAVWHYADMESAAVTAELSRWKNGGQPGMIVGVPAEVSDDYVKQVEAAFRRKAGPAQAGTTMVLRSPTLLQSSSKPHEMNYQIGLQVSQKAIYDAAGIPESVWRMNDANRASATTGNAEWGRVIYERQCAVAGDLTEWLLPMFGVEPGEMWFAYDNPVEEDVDAEVDRIRDAFVASAGRIEPVVDVNEYRDALGLDPRETKPGEKPDMESADGSAPLAPAASSEPQGTGAAVAPAGADVAATALNGAQVQALADLAAQVAQGQLPLDSARALATAAFPMVPSEVLDAVFNPLKTFTPEVPNGQGQQGAEAQAGGGSGASGPGGDAASANGGGNDTAQSGNDGGAKGGRKPAGLGAKAGRVELIHVPRWGEMGCGCGRKAVENTDDSIETQMFRAVQAWAEDALNRGIRGIGADGSFDISLLAESELRSAVNTAVQAAFNAGAISFTESTGSDSPPLSSEAARQYVQQYTADLVKGATETMVKQMRTVIDAGLEKGQTVQQIQQDLTDRVPEISLNRAEVIARTETARAYQHGSMKQAEELGFTGKEWSLSSNPCGLCEGAAAAVAGKPTPIDQPFFTAGTTIMGTDGKVYTVSMDVRAAADLHPQCQCGTVTAIGGGE